jgi:hypothetical protein
MRTRHLVAIAAILLVVLSATIPMSTPASRLDAEVDDDVDPTAEGDLAGRVAALETAVAALQTSVASLQPTDTAPTPVSLVALSCGRPFASWGTATTDGVRVQVLQVESGAEVDFAVEGATVYAVKLTMDN